MFKTIRSWIYWWKLGRKAKKHLQWQLDRTKNLGPAEPPTPEQVEAFKKEYDMGWNSHMVQKIENKRTYYEAELG